MKPCNDESTLDLPQRLGTPQLKLPKLRASIGAESMASLISGLPYQAPNSSVSSLFASTSTPAGSRSAPPSVLGSVARIRTGSVFGGACEGGHHLSAADRAEDPRNLILQAFVPHIAVHTSEDTKELLKDKGFKEGLWELLRPFGEQIQGKVTVRDSIGAGRTWEDYAVRFVQLGDGLEVANVAGSRKNADGKVLPINGNRIDTGIDVAQRSRTGGDIASIETLVDRHLAHAEDFPNTNSGNDYLTLQEGISNPDIPSPFYTLYLRRLLSGIPLAPHETFSHPVACVIAISSRNKSPIETLRNLYDESSHGEKRMPIWVNSEYLRYYVLVHDEERDDISKSITLFDQMKRHFGLHCHLLRLRSSQCVASDDDSIELPRCEWIAASEEISEIQAREHEEEMEYSRPCIYESDTTAIKTFIREMVTQSIVPSMERCVATWNDQVASRRRGISGRFLSISKSWTGFGRSSRNSSSSSSTASGGSSNFDAVQGFYRPDTSEAIMRKLADYAFMLRDWKLALSTYELLRSDFNNDKAWKYHAAANEMAAISALLVPQAINSKTRSETVNQMLETASYSYLTRCGASYGVSRSLALGMELLRLRGGSATIDAAKWGIRLLEYKVLGTVGHALIKERISACYACKKGVGSGLWGSRTRKSALWSIQAADSWLFLGKPQQSKQRLEEATSKYALLSNKDSLSKYSAASAYLQSLQREVQLALFPESGIEGPGGIEDFLDNSVAEETEAFDSRPNRKSLIGEKSPGLSALESAPLNGTLLGTEFDQAKADQFE